MALEFVIIPSKQLYEDYADDIVIMMRNNIKREMDIEIDRDYDKSLSSRINEWTDKEYDVINVDENYGETNTIVVRFSDKGSNPEKMELTEFVDLVSSFEDDDDKKETADDETADDETSCIIM